MNQRTVEMRTGKNTKELSITTLGQDESEPVAYMVSRMKAKKPIEGLTAVDINVDVIHIIDLAKESVKTGKPARFK